ALAHDALAPLNSPEYLNLRQTVARELAALQALPADPRARAAGELDALQAALPTLASRAPGATADTPADASTWRRLADAVIHVRPSNATDLISPDDRAAGEAALGQIGRASCRESRWKGAQGLSFQRPVTSG